MRKIKEVIQKPSDAIQFMIDGLIEQDKRTDFEVDMGTYGSAGFTICYGCAAICAAQKAFGKNLTTETINGRQRRADFFDIDRVDLAYFESAIDTLRCGSASHLFQFFKIEQPEVEREIWYLQDHNWKHELPKVQAYCDKLKALGL